MKSTKLISFVIFSILINAFNVCVVKAGEREELAKKLLKIFLAASLLKPPKLGLFPLPLPLPLPLPIKKVKPPIIIPPFIQGGYPWL